MKGAKFQEKTNLFWQ